MHASFNWSLFLINCLLWFVVYPLLLILALFAIRAFYRWHKRQKDEQETREVLKRNEEQKRKIRDSWQKPNN